MCVQLLIYSLCVFVFVSDITAQQSMTGGHKQQGDVGNITHISSLLYLSPPPQGSGYSFIDDVDVLLFSSSLFLSVISFCTIVFFCMQAAATGGF